MNKPTDPTSEAMPSNPAKYTPSRHGATQPESARRNKALLLRLPPDVIERIRKLAAERQVTVSALVAEWATR